MAVKATKLQIIKYPDPRLRQRCKPVERWDAQLGELARHMIDLMHDARGVGLAAPQVGVLVRMFVCQPSEEVEARVITNPVLRLGDEDAEADEGCLSVPDVNVVVRRAVRCHLSGFDAEGRPITAEADGLLARIWQHETDHLDGRLITDRMTEAEKIANRKLLKELERTYEKTHKPRRK